MLRLSYKKFFILASLVLGVLAATAQAGEHFNYRYIRLDDQVPPPPAPVVFSNFFATQINDRGQVSGDIAYCDEMTCQSYVGIYEHGQTKRLQEGISGPLNESGVIGGSVIIDAENFFTQAALFRRTGRVELIPPLPDEVSSEVIALNDKNTALVRSFDRSFNSRIVLYKNGKSSVLDFEPGIYNPDFLKINNQEIISGTGTVTSAGNFCNDAKAFRYKLKNDNLQVLEPLPTENLAWGLGINEEGNVLGYSFICGGLERIGIWDRTGHFNTYFVEGTPDFPTVSNRLVFNERNQIAISEVSSPASDRLAVSYLVPRKGVRLNIKDLIVNQNDLPADAKFGSIRDINNHGDMVGFDYFGFGGNFLLHRLGDSEKLLATNDPATVPPARASKPVSFETNHPWLKQYFRKKQMRGTLKVR